MKQRQERPVLRSVRGYWRRTSPARGDQPPDLDLGSSVPPRHLPQASRPQATSSPSPVRRQLVASAQPPCASACRLGRLGGGDPIPRPSPAFLASSSLLWPFPASPGLPSPATAGRQPMGPGRVRAAQRRQWRQWRRRGPLCGVAGDHGGGTKRGQGGSRVPFLRPMFSTPHNLSEFNLPLRALAVENSFMSTNPGRSKGRHRDRFEGGDVAILLPLLGGLFFPLPLPSPLPPVKSFLNKKKKNGDKINQPVELKHMLDLNNLFAVINNCSSISLVMLMVQIRVKSIPSLLNRPIDRGRSIFLPRFNSFFLQAQVFAAARTTEHGKKKKTCT